ncbi:MAG: rod-binding protein [Pseudomonadota bacterium]|nr:rod-binding protein [Pseudomonadota bacterium]
MNGLSLNNTQMAAQQYASEPKLMQASYKKFLAPAQSAETKARTAANEFESFFLYQMLELTDPGVNEDFGGGHAEAAFKRIQHEHIAEEMTKAGGIGLSDTIYDQLIKLQEVK